MEEKNILIEALKRFSENPETIENFSSYLDSHFLTWCEKWAKTPDGFIFELDQFSRVEV